MGDRPEIEEARRDAQAIQSRAREGAQAHLQQVQAAVDGLLERVAGLERGVAEAQRDVREAGEEMARRLAESADPLASALRGRAEALAAELDLIGRGIAAGVAADAEPAEPGGTAKPAADDERQASDQDRPQARTGLLEADLDDAVGQLDREAGAAAAETEDRDEGAAPSDDREAGRADDGDPERGHGVERARLVALNMVVTGASRADAERHLREELEIADPGDILDEVYARTGDRA